MSERVEKAQRCCRVRISFRTERASDRKTKTALRVGSAIALLLVAACSGDPTNTSGGASGSGGAGGDTATGGAAGSSGAAGSGTAGGSTGGAAGRDGGAGTGGAAGASIDAGSRDAVDARTDANPSVDAPTDAGPRDVSTDSTTPPIEAGADVTGGNLTVVSVLPTARGIQAAVGAPIVVHFDRALKRDTVTSKTLWAYGRWGGPIRNGVYAFSDNDTTVSMTPPRNWPAGDRITVVMSHDLQGADGTKLRSQGYSFQYSTATKVANLMFTENGRLTSRSPAGTGVRTYGGSVSDLNGDGFLDLLTTNEDSADLRIFMNKGDGNGTYLPFVTPPTPLGKRVSPSETTDFNGDGIVDLVTANLDDDTLSILFGKGDGTFTLSQTPKVGGQPRGVAVIDADGDGDIDIVNTNADGDNMCLLLNDGTGKFPLTQAAGIVYFDSAFGMGIASQEFGLFAGDMNEDGILDIVIGARGLSGANAGVVVDLGTGAGSFKFGSLQAPATSGWQLAVGDLNGDGHEDVATADADLSATLTKNTVTILTGDGTGKLTPIQTFSGPLNRPFAIDLGDLDGDKDLDVVVSNYSGNWQILVNDGTGKVTQNQSFPPSKSASCALLIDIDNDQDLDLVVVDEEQDEVVVLRQGP